MHVQIARYVEFYSKVSRFSSWSAQLTDISNSSITVATLFQTYTIPVDPPMESLFEARTRLIDMDRKALVGLGRSPVTIKTYLPPKGFHLVVWIACALTFAMISREAHVLPGGWAYEGFLKWIPGLDWFVQIIRPTLLFIMVRGHLFPTRMVRTTNRMG
jgi:hypothetical protein